MKKLLLPVLPLLLLLSVFSCKDESAKPPVSLKELAQSGSINVSQRDYTVQIPDGWTQADTLVQGVKVRLIMSPPVAGLPEASINILNEDMQGQDLNAYRKLSMSNVQKSMPGSELRDQGEFDAGGVKGTWFRYLIIQPGAKVSVINYTIAGDGIAYIITAGCDHALMDKYRSMFNHIAESFRFKN